MYFLRPVGFLLSFIIISTFTGASQCVTNFPYTEDFEVSDGSWTTGGNASDWAWGTPNKAAISHAGNGVKCWVSGGLTGSRYNDNEASWLQSPCFDFTSINSPFISFFINWNTEKGYDGAALQYSDDNGATWQSAGSYGEAPTSCEPDNWYTDANIRYAVQPAGWSGSSLNTGKDVAGWLVAMHSFPQLKGKSNIRFRFVFGAGNIKNDYEGVAIDGIYIGETTDESEFSFSYTCSQTAREAFFSAYRARCIDFSTMQWNFSDAFSGAANIIYGGASIHTFSGAGSYLVTLTGKDKFGNELYSSQTVIIPNVTAVIKTPVLCYGGTGVVEAAVTNTNELTSYNWSTDPPVASSSAQVKAGNYTVTASVLGECLNNASVTLPEPPALHHDVQTTQADCNNLNGSATITESSGLPPYQYAWPSGTSAAPSTQNLSAGVYSVVVTDKNQCRDTASVIITKQASTLNYSSEYVQPGCGRKDGYIQLHPILGNPPYTYEWIPAVSLSDKADDIDSGTYTIIITDNSRCRDTAVIRLVDQPIHVSLGKDTTICEGQTILLQANNSFDSYLWNDGTTTSVKEVSREGNYSLTVTNRGNCRASDTIHVSVGCEDLVFLSGFTPNGDGLNEEWGAKGGLSLVLSYRMLVYNRYGNIVFESTNPYQKWKGDVKGKIATGTYVFVASYTYRGEKKIKKGTITLVL